MRGYATNAADLSLGDTLGGVLATGDIGHCDDEGFFFLSGRARRLCKVFGLRFNLDEFEALARLEGPRAAIAGKDRIILFNESQDADALSRERDRLAQLLRLHPSALDFRSISALPLLASGKVDYAALEESAHGR